MQRVVHRGQDLIHGDLAIVIGVAALGKRLFFD